ncbi:anaphase-promoting complex subunit cdc27 [Desmophyllum pertusum]|uniref:Cell division cycle protein 27 homolog n=1 Tax=Desmophyllum pertusum TaxID=174260 RepID=A0A9W9ZFQ5_9CNID|nr:anaphase-promoting complex subunit cdc27 [Desmophyllum pertusum]
MVCEEPIRASIWHALSHYAYNDAIFLAERLFAEVGSDDTLYLLATCFYQAGYCKRAYSLLQSKGCPTPLCRFLFAKCCMDLDKLAEGEMALTGGCLTNSKPLETIASEFGSAAGYGLALLGQICRKSEQFSRAAECFKSSLKYNPYLWSSFENLCQLGEKPDPADYFKSSSCPKITSSISHREHMTVGSATITMDTTSPSDNQRRNIDSVSSENLDPSQNATPQNNSMLIAPSVPSSRPGSIELSGGCFSVQSSAVSVVGEKRMRQRVGRNLLGATQSSSPLTPSFGMLSSDTPTNDQNTVPFITPSPAGVEGHAPKAPLKKGGNRRSDLSCKPVTTITSSVHSMHSPSMFTSSPHGSGHSNFSSNAPSVRRSSRLFTLSSSNTTVSSFDSSNKDRRTKSARVSSPSTCRSAVSNVVKKTRRQTRSSTPQPLAPCVENVIQEGSSTQQNTEGRGQGKLSPIQNSMDGLMSLLKHIGQAYVHLSSYECKQALTAFSSLAPHHYNTGWVLTQVGRAHFELAEYQLAEKVFAKVRQLEPYRIEGMEIYSTTLWHLQNEVALSALAQDLVETDRTSPQAWCATGNCFSLQKEHDTAIKFFQRAVQVNPAFTYAYTLLGHEYVLTEELDRAMSCFRQAIRTDSRHYNAWYGIGMIYYKQEKFNLAEIHFRKALSINPSSSVLYCHVGVVQHAMKKSEAALITINKAMTIDPKNPLCKFHRASILFSMDKHQEALEELEELKKIVPREALVYFLISKVYRKLGQNHLAQMNFSWAIDLDPKGANNQIKEAINKRYLPDDDDNTMGLDTADTMDQSVGVDDLSDEEGN